MEASPPAAPGLEIRQKRSRKTYNALIATGFALLEKREFEAITIAELAQAAGYSVGAFYARFKSKDEFFQALIAHHLEERYEAREEILGKAPVDRLVGVLVGNLVTYYWKRRRFWRAALMRSTYDTGSWDGILKQAQEFGAALIARIEQDAKRRLTKTERANVLFAFHLVLSTINNRIVNRPLPTNEGQEALIADLERAFRLVSAYDDLVAAGSAGAKRPARRARS
jgi:AcrR family transcriptional regulator